MWAARQQIERGRDRRHESGGGNAQISRSPPRGAPPYLDVPTVAASRHSLLANSSSTETKRVGSEGVTVWRAAWAGARGAQRGCSSPVRLNGRTQALSFNIILLPVEKKPKD